MSEQTGHGQAEASEQGWARFRPKSRLLVIWTYNANGGSGIRDCPQIRFLEVERVSLAPGITHYLILFTRIRPPVSVGTLRPSDSTFVERGSNGLPFAHNKSPDSRRYRAVHGHIAGRCERSGGDGEGQHRKQCTRSPRIGERERCVAKAQRIAPSSIRSRCLHTDRRCGPEKRSRLGRLGNNSLCTIIGC
jgi:hypothetical protein